MREKDEIRSLNTLRGVAALMVALYHSPALFGTKHVIPHAYLAVDLFFVISGFIMAHVYGAKIREGLPLGEFMRRRMARLYPLYLAVTLAGAGLYLWRHPSMPSELAAAFGLNLVLMPVDTEGVLVNRAAYPFALQSWSIVWEIALSALFFGWARWIGRHALAIAAVAGLLLAVAAMTRGTLDGGFTLASFWVGGLRALFGFAAGAAVFGALSAGIRPGMWKALGIAAIPAGLAAVGYVFNVRRTFWAADLVIVVALLPLLVAALAQFRPRWAEHRIGDFIGEASYSVYLLQGVGITLAGIWLLQNPYMAQPWRFVFGCSWLVVFVAASWLCWRYFETPARKALSGRARGREMAFNAAA